MVKQVNSGRKINAALPHIVVHRRTFSSKTEETVTAKMVCGHRKHTVIIVSRQVKFIVINQ